MHLPWDSVCFEFCITKSSKNNQLLTGECLTDPDIWGGKTFSLLPMYTDWKCSMDFYHTLMLSPLSLAEKEVCLFCTSATRIVLLTSQLKQSNLLLSALKWTKGLPATCWKKALVFQKSVWHIHAYLVNTYKVKAKKLILFKNDK